MDFQRNRETCLRGMRTEKLVWRGVLSMVFGDTTRPKLLDRVNLE